MDIWIHVEKVKQRSYLKVDKSDMKLCGILVPLCVQQVEIYIVGDVNNCKSKKNHFKELKWMLYISERVLNQQNPLIF